MTAMVYAVLISASVIAILVIFLVWSCASVSSGIWVRTLCRELKKGKSVLTFDDGPDPVTTPLILDILEKYGVKACFFVIGSRAEQNPDLVRRIAECGHTIGNHTYSHSPLFPLSGVPVIVSDIRACDSAVKAALDGLPSVSSSSSLYFRPPFGVTNPDIARALKKTGHTAVGWSVRSLDTVIIRDSLPEDKVAAAVARCSGRVIRKLRPGSVVLLHDRLKYSPRLLESILERSADSFR